MILLISNSRDFATDFVVAKLRELECPYLRIDLDLLQEEHVALDPVKQTLSIIRETELLTLEASDAKSILYRAPTHLRESSGGRDSPEESLARHQWTAFARSLMVFDGPNWINHPCATYRAENKPYQLMLAARLGLAVPHSLVTNSVPGMGHPIWCEKDKLAFKALDSFLLRLKSGEDAFFYTQCVTRNDFEEATLRAMPAIVQQFLDAKLDLRVTVVGEHCFAVSVLVDDKGIDGDWRLAKDSATFEIFQLPELIRARCVALVKQLGLVFGAIDLAKVGDEFYFLEVNPTGEWAWLVTQCRLPIDRAIANELSR